jgi:hypothetical protein
MGRKYIGVDLGAWYGNKTRIAILEEKYKDGKLKLYLISIDSEPMVVINDPYERNKQLVEFLKNNAKNNAIIGIDAPFAIPYHLCNPLEDGDITETLYNPNNPKYQISGELKNQFIYDNSARFVYSKTGEKALAPAGDKIGKMTARMIHMVNEYKDELNIIKTPHLDIQSKSLSTIEVYPRATLKKIFFENETIKPYKGDKWDDEKADMLKILTNPQILKNPLVISEKIKIDTDDDYDAIICALTAYLVSHKDYGYLKPEEEDLDKFTNSFIYIPENLKSL